MMEFASFAMLRANRVVLLKNRLDPCPSGFDGNFASEQRPVSGHGVAQKGVVGLVFAALRLDGVKPLMITHKILAGTFDACRKRDRRIGRDPEAQVVGRPARRYGIVE